MAYSIVRSCSLDSFGSKNIMQINTENYTKLLNEKIDIIDDLFSSTGNTYFLYYIRNKLCKYMHKMQDSVKYLEESYLKTSCIHFRCSYILDESLAFIYYLNVRYLLIKQMHSPLSLCDMSIRSIVLSILNFHSRVSYMCSCYSALVDLLYGKVPQTVACKILCALDDTVVYIESGSTNHNCTLVNRDKYVALLSPQILSCIRYSIRLYFTLKVN